MKRLLIIFLLVLTLFLTGCNQTENEKYSAALKKVKVGMDIDQVEKIMGKVEETYSINNNYICYYWFVGADSIEEAQKQTKKGVAISYYGVIFYTDNYEDFYVREKADIISGTWGKD